jgi:hypothetical protein
VEPLVIIAIIVLFIGLAAWGIYAAAQRRKELQAWAQAKGLRYSRDKRRNIHSEYPEFKCLRQGSNRYAYNTIEGSISNRTLRFFDYHYETHSTNSKGRRQTHHHRFSALILDSALPLSPLLIRPEGFFDKVTEFFGFDDIDFESAEFSRKFFVKAEDRRWAYDVIHQRTMQFLLDMPRFTIQFDSQHVIAFRSSTYKVADIEAGLQVLEGLLDRLPDYVKKELQDNG